MVAGEQQTFDWKNYKEEKSECDVCFCFLLGAHGIKDRLFVKCKAVREIWTVLETARFYRRRDNAVDLWNLSKLKVTRKTWRRGWKWCWMLYAGSYGWRGIEGCLGKRMLQGRLNGCWVPGELCYCRRILEMSSFIFRKIGWNEVVPLPMEPFSFIFCAFLYCFLFYNLFATSQ